MSEFDDAIRLTSSGAGTYAGELGSGWRIGNGVNGGVVLAVAAHALSLELGQPAGDRPGHPHPVAISAYYLTPSLPGPVTVRTEVLRRGGRSSNAAATVTQPGPDGEVERIRVLAAYADLAASDADFTSTAPAPDLPAPEDCVPREASPPAFLASAELLHRVDMRLDPATAGWAVGKPSGQAEIRGWLRMVDGREPDPLSLLLAVDALPPVAFELGRPGWAPTFELTAHVRRTPAPGWLRVRVSSRTLGGGLLEEDAEVWDSTGALVAVSRQLAGVGRGAPPSH